jgi:hypothetical protein
MPSAIFRMDNPAAIPREISSRSDGVNAICDRLRLTGAIPPRRRKTPYIDPPPFFNALAMSLRDSPAFQRFQSSAFPEATFRADLTEPMQLLR